MAPSFLTALTLGFLSSAHCVGMCGPLVLSIPFKGQRWSAVTLYHVGRIGVYSLIGLVLGVAGRRIYLAGWQQGLSVSLGALILAGLVLGRFRKSPAQLYAPLYRWMAALWASPSKKKFFLMGVANGLLPCGMVYLALAGALTSDTAPGAMAFMAFFGLGTLPLLLGLQVTGHLAAASFRHRLRAVLPFLTVAMAVLLILRGLNLGIPFVSPVLAGGQAQAILCH